MNPPRKPLMIWDGDCGFCRRWIARWERRTQGRVDYDTYQNAFARFPEIHVDEFRKAVHLIEPDGAVHRGAAAVMCSLALAPHGGLGWWMYRRVPGFALASEAAYAVVAANRGFFSWLTRWLWGNNTGPSEYFQVRRLFLRCLAVIYAIAFGSLWVQLDGLIGSRGILPASDYLARMGEQLGPMKWRVLPTLAWLDSSDRALHLMCAAGSVCSVLLFLQKAPALCALALWGLYLSLCCVGQTFFNFQWDVLLLETGLLAVLFAPWRLKPRPTDDPPSGLSIFLLRLLIAKLMWLSGYVKLASNDGVWSKLAALDYHYFTQPIPNPLSWHAHQLPTAFQQASVAVMFAIELGLPLLVFAPRNLRAVAAAGFAALMVLILATGNYTFFNLLALALCLPLLDDSQLRRITPRRWRVHYIQSGQTPRPDRIHRAAVWAAGLVILSMTVLQINTRVGGNPEPAWAKPFVDEIETWRSVSTYGLFARMTTERNEIVIEGSDDGAAWKPYEFKYKPGALDRRPPQIAPHQPRLDWQMWFAALGSIRRNPWLVATMRRILEGSPEVLALLDTNPFPNQPPKYLRASFYKYEFTSEEERQATGNWWNRELTGLYTQPISLDSFRQ